jgi:DNA-binding transcriptional LysR family regulator
MLRGGECDVALAFRYPDAAGGAPQFGHGTPRAVRAEAVLEAQAQAAAGDWSDLVVRPLLDDPLVGLLPSGHPLAERDEDKPVELAELAGEQWIAGCPQCRGHLVELCQAAGFGPAIDFATDDYPAVVGLVAAGLGVAVLPRLALASVRRSGVAVVPVRTADGPAIREIVALTLPDLAEVPAVELMLDQLAAAAAIR